jgi:hypothetical protein
LLVLVLLRWLRRLLVLVLVLVRWLRLRLRRPLLLPLLLPDAPLRPARP